MKEGLESQTAKSNLWSGVDSMNDTKLSFKGYDFNSAVKFEEMNYNLDDDAPYYVFSDH